VDTLRQDPKLKQRLKRTQGEAQVWEEAKAIHAKAAGTGFVVPEPGPEPTLDEVLADQERQRLFRVIEHLVLWRTHNETVLQQRATRLEQLAARLVSRMGHPRAKGLFDRKKLLLPRPFAERGAPLERSGSGWRVMRVTESVAVLSTSDLRSRRCRGQIREPEAGKGSQTGTGRAK